MDYSGELIADRSDSLINWSDSSIDWSNYLISGAVLLLLGLFNRLFGTRTCLVYSTNSLDLLLLNSVNWPK